MIQKLKPYPAYKDSGVEWLGKVPEGWKIRPGRALFKEIIERGHTNEQLLSVTITKGVILQVELFSHTSKKDSSNEDKSAYKLVEPGDLVYNKMRAWQGAVGVSTYRGLVSPAYIVQRLRDPYDLPCYFHYLLRTPHFAKEAERWSYGITSDQWSLRSEDFKGVLFPYPSTNEQRAIVKFIDWTDRRIRLIIAARKKRIQLLEEYRQTLINDAVTGKFDVRTGKPYPAYKDSGVEWLGNVPEGWEVVRLKRIARLAYGDSLPADKRSEGGITVFGSNGPVGHHDQTNTLVPVIIVGRKGSFGKVQYSFYPVYAIDTTFYIDSRHTEVDLRWLYYMLTQLELDRISRDSAVPGLDREEVYAKPAPLPPLPEQRAIAEYLDRETKKVDATIEKTKKSIELWEELRATLIADVVTGKLDVREVAEGLPEEEPELTAKIEAFEASLQANEAGVDEGAAEGEEATLEETA
ncbi:restriction endonuclease subunit S [Deinococcota bacterium DY0809b]